MNSSKSEGSCSDALVGLIIVIVIAVVAIQLLPFIFMLAMIILISYLLISGFQSFFSSDNKNDYTYNSNLTSGSRRPTSSNDSISRNNDSNTKSNLDKNYSVNSAWTELNEISYEKKDITKVFKLKGVTYDNRQTVIKFTNKSTPLTYKRDYYNKHDEYAIEIVDLYGSSMGWVPKSENEELAKEIDKGRKFHVGISQKYGGENYNYGLEVVMSTDKEAIKSIVPRDKTTDNLKSKADMRVAKSTNTMDDIEAFNDLNFWYERKVDIINSVVTSKLIEATEKIKDNLGDASNNFYVSSYVCPDCGSQMYKTVFPPGKEYRITVHKKDKTVTGNSKKEIEFLIKRLFTCHQCKTLFTAKYNTLSEGFVYESKISNSSDYEKELIKINKMGATEGRSDSNNGPVEYQSKSLKPSNDSNSFTVKFHLTNVNSKNIETTELDTPIYGSRRYFNKDDDKAIEIRNTYGKSLGWVPKSENTELAKEIDKGRKFHVGISQKYGGNNYNFGLEVVMSTDEKVIKNITPIDKTTNSNPNYDKRAENGTKNINGVVDLANSEVAEKRSVNTTTNINLDPVTKDQKLFSHYVITGLTDQEISSEQIDYFLDLGKVDEIETIEDCALYCAMMYDSIIDYLITLKSGLNTPSGRQYLSKEYLESIFPRLDAIVHKAMLEKNSPELLNYFKSQILKTHDSDSKEIPDEVLINLMTVCVGIFNLCYYTDKNYSQITSKTSSISEINFENIDYSFLTQLSTFLLKF